MELTRLIPTVDFRILGGREPRALPLAVAHVVVAGWTGRDAEAVDRHIRELEALGVARPASIPTFYRVSATRVVTSPSIEVLGDRSAGEVECVYVQSGGRLYVGVGSDHTDREVEAYNVSVSKQICDKPVAPALWELDDVAAHWDRLVLRSWIEDGGRRVLYQEGAVAAIQSPFDLIQRYTGSAALPDGTVMFGGTLAALGGVRPSRRFEFELDDPVLKRRIAHAYDVAVLPMAT